MSDELIAVRPSLGQLLGPLIELSITLGCALSIPTLMNSLPLGLLIVLLLISIILGPVGILGLVYGATGSSFRMERKKQTARWQQRFLGVGIRTVELVPFERVKRIEVRDDYDSVLNSGELQDIVQFEVVLVMDNDRRLMIGTLATPRPLVDLGAERANRLAEHVAAMAGVEAALADLPALDAVKKKSSTDPTARRRRRARRVLPPNREA